MKPNRYGVFEPLDPHELREMFEAMSFAQDVHHARPAIRPTRVVGANRERPAAPVEDLSHWLLLAVVRCGYGTDRDRTFPSLITYPLPSYHAVTVDLNEPFLCSTGLFNGKHVAFFPQLAGRPRVVVPRSAIDPMIQPYTFRGHIELGIVEYLDPFNKWVVINGKGGLGV